MLKPPPVCEEIEQVDQTDLRSLVDCSYWTPADASLEDVHKAFQKHGHEFMAVIDGDMLCGICSRSGIGMVLGSRFGFSIFSKKPVRDHMLPNPIVIRLGTPCAKSWTRCSHAPPMNFMMI
jgi:hypothetical protein